VRPWSVLLPLVLALASCDAIGNCDGVSCTPMLIVPLTQGLDRDGDYHVTLGGDVDLACDFTVVDGLIDPGDCTGDLRVPDSGNTTLFMNVGPEESMLLAIAYNDELIADHELQPAWDTTYPGGRLCGNACPRGVEPAPVAITWSDTE